jgi:hypothetical protein
MSAEKIDLAALDRNLQEFARQQKDRGWWRRNWRRLVLVLLLLMVAGTGGAYWLLIGRIHHLEVYQTAMQAIRADKQMRQELGEPIHSVKWPLRSAVPSARIEEREIDILWAIHGPKAVAKVHLHAKMMKKWEIDTLQVTVNDKTRLIQTAGDSEDEAPAFGSSPKKPETKQPEPNKPAPDINLPVPPGEPPSK